MAPLFLKFKRQAVVRWPPRPFCETLVGIIFLIFVSSALFSPWFVQGKVLAPFDLLQGLISPWNQHDFQAVPKVHNHFVSDAVTQYLPYVLFSKASFESDGYVGWNPLVFGGVAQHANTMAIPYDWSQGLYRWLDFWPAWHLGRFCQFLIAGIGMFIFLRGRGCASGVALTAATAYMLNTQFIVWIYHHWALASFCWIPWLFWALYKARDGEALYLLPSTLFLSLSLCGGTLQHAAFVAMALFCLWLGWLGESRRLGFPLLRATLLLLATAILALALTAPMLEATIHAYLENLRSGQVRGGLGYSGGWPQPILNLLSVPFYAFPLVLGSPASLDLWKLFRSDLMNVASFGTLPVLLAFWGLFSRKVPLPARWLAAAGLLIPLSPLVGPLYHRVQLLWIFGGCWCAAAWLQKSSPRELRSIFRMIGISGGILIVLWIAASGAALLMESRWEPILQEKVQALSNAGQFGIFANWMQARTQALFSCLSIWNPVQIVYLAGFALSVTCLCVWFSPTNRFWIIPAIGVGLQGLACWWQWSTWSQSREEIYQSPSWVKVLQEQVGMNGRLAQSAGGYATQPFGPNTLQPSQVPIAAGYESIHPIGLNAREAPWEFPGTTHFLGPKNGAFPKGWQTVHADKIWRLWKNPEPTFGFVVFANGDQELLREGSVCRPSFNTMTVSMPAGAERVELFTNGHRGWKWKDGNTAEWHETQRGSDGALVLLLEKPFSEKITLLLQYQASGPRWAVWVQTVAATLLLGIVAIRIGALVRAA